MPKREIDCDRVAELQEYLDRAKATVDDWEWKLAEAKMQWEVGTILERQIRMDCTERIKIMGVTKNLWHSPRHDTYDVRIKQDGTEGSIVFVYDYAMEWQEVTNE